jgi:hypothetical protein
LRHIEKRKIPKLLELQGRIGILSGAGDGHLTDVGNCGKIQENQGEFGNFRNFKMEHTGT